MPRQPIPPISRTTLPVLTAAKTVTNTALRWIGPFLPTLERAFGTSTAQLTSIIGASELGGLSTTAAGGVLDRGRHRFVFLAGLAAVTLSSLVALAGSTWSFAISMTVLVVGVSNLTVAGHAWISHHVPYAGRGRAFGVFEMSWAFALLIGAPVLALLIRWVGWRGPYAALAVLTIAAFVLVIRTVPPDDVTPRAPRSSTARIPLPRSAWVPVFASALAAGAGMSIFVVSGTWLDGRYGVSTAGLGLVATAFGGIELCSSAAVAFVSDHLGKRRSVVFGLVVLFAGLAVQATAADSTARAVAGLIVFLAGFEYAFVSSLSLVSEAAPATRGRAIALSNAVGTLARASAVATSGLLYTAFGMDGSIVLSACLAAVAFSLMVGAIAIGVPDA